MMLNAIVKKPASGRRAAPILFIHGAFHGAWCWDAFFLDYFVSRGYEVHAVDLRGHGVAMRGEKANRTRISDHCQDIHEYVQTLPSQPILVGHSMGGYIAQKYSSAHAPRALVLLSAPPPSGILWSISKMFLRHPIIFLASLFALDLFGTVGNPRLFKEAFFSHDADMRLISEYWKKIGNESLHAFLEMALFPSWKKIPETIPTLIMGGQNDRMFTEKEISSAATRQGLAPVIVPGIAHDCMLESQWKMSADAIEKWLESERLNEY